MTASNSNCPASVQVFLEDPAANRLRFTGTWGAVAGQPARFYGTVQRGDDGEAQLAALSAASDGNGITVLLSGGDGAALAPPRLLRPVPAAPPAACPV